MKLRGTRRSRWSRSWAAAGAANRRLTSAGDSSGESGRQPRANRRARRHAAPAVLVILTTCLAVLGLGSAVAGARTTPGRATADAAAPPTYGALYQDGPTDRWLLSGQWLYRSDPTDQGIADGFWRNAASTEGWAPVTIPNSFNAGDLSTASMNGSVGWYRRDFTVPAGAFAKYVPARFRSWIVRFESVNYRATVWLNGKPIGSHAGAYLPFEFDLKGVRAGVNRLVVRVDDRRDGSALPPGPQGGWWSFGGLQREVYLRSVQRVDMSPVVVRPILSCPTCAATIQEQVSVRNVTGSPQTVSLQGRYGSARLNFGGHTVAPHATWVAHASIKITSPHLWAPDDPYLYKATVGASDQDGRALQTYVTHSGIRSIAVAPTGQLLLNGRLLNLRGFSIHEQNLQTGAALDPAQLAALVAWDRELGGGIIRAHYPFNPEIEEMADRYGILLWSEVPVYQVATKFLTRPGWLTSAHAFLRQNILVNQNHPSVLLWSIGNELATPPNDAEARYIAGAAQLAHQLDPTRPVGMAIEDWPGVSCQQAYAPLDVIGVNDYFGWFDSGGGTADDRDALSPFLDTVHACYPSKALMITEFGFEGNRAGPVEERGTFAYQAATAAFHLNVFASKPYISAAMWFAMQDFAARPGWGGGDPLPDPPFVQKGPIDINGNPREPLFGTLQSIYTHTQQIAPVAAATRRHGHRPKR